MRWMSSRMPSTSSATSRLYWSSFGFGGAAAADVAGCCPGVAVSETVTAATAATIQKRDRCMNPPGILERDSRTDSHDSRRNNAQRPQERRARVVAGVLLGVRVEQVEQIQEPRHLQTARQREHFLGAQIEQRDVVLTPRAERLGEDRHRGAVVQARRRDEDAADR